MVVKGDVFEILGRGRKRKAVVEMGTTGSPKFGGERRKVKMGDPL